MGSLDSLRHFEGLLGHCPETSIIEAPARQANLPRARMINQNDADAFEAPWQFPTVDPAERPPIVADGSRSELRTASQERRRGSRTRAVASRDGTQVSIIPDPEQFWDIAAIEAPDAADLAGNPGDVEAVLALRPLSYTTAFDHSITSAARRYGVDPLLLHSVIKQESGYRMRATSRVGARGLMQVMPGTGRMLGVTDAAALYDPEINIGAGARLLNQLWSKFNGNIDLVLAAYNAGEGAVRKYGDSVPPYKETREYVARVKANYQRLAAESGLAVDF